LQQLCRKPESPLQVEFILALHPPDGVLPRGETVWGSGVRVDGQGTVQDLIRKNSVFFPFYSACRAKTGWATRACSSWVWFQTEIP
jgi:hypothetical protein